MTDTDTVDMIQLSCSVPVRSGMSDQERNRDPRDRQHQQPLTQPDPVGEEIGDEPAQHQHVALCEVQDAGGSVHDVEAHRDDRKDRPDGDAPYDDDQDFTEHRFPPVSAESGPSLQQIHLSPLLN
jgi:hypothetical protein